MQPHITHREIIITVQLLASVIRLRLLSDLIMFNLSVKIFSHILLILV